MAKVKPEYGIFKNSIPYASYGNGNKILLLFFGGPGNALYPPCIKRKLLKGIFWLVGSFVHKPKSETFSQDVLIEAKAEVEHDSTESLKKISVPVLILCGDKDFYFPSDYVKEMENLIDHATIKFYENKGHEIISDPRFAKDIFEFIK